MGNALHVCRRWGRWCAVLAMAVWSGAGAMALGAGEPLLFSLRVDTGTELRKFSPRRLGGTNVALWNDRAHFSDPQIRQWMDDLRPGYIRLPGGSWSNAVYWNGNGVRGEDGKIDHSRIGPDGYPAVDYSGYKPGFLAGQGWPVQPSKRYNGNIDVKSVQDWILSLRDVELMPCLNAGLARPIDGAEWVRFNNFTHPKYHSKIWEIGNELDGSWEPGYKLPDGSNMTADVYVKRYNSIAAAAKKVDPAIKIGGLAFAKEMIEHCGEYVDFVSIHTYPGTTSISPQANLAAVTGVIEREVSRVRGWIREFQPQRESQIEIGYTEWNLSGGLNASDLFSGLWHARMLAEMTRNGVDFSTQWDVFTHSRGMTSGHALIWSDKNRFVRKAGYYAMWMWNNFTGNRLLKDSVTPAKEGTVLYSFTSRDDQAVYLQLVNPDEDQEAHVKIQLDGTELAERGEIVSLTGREYFWDASLSVPQWSNRPRVTPIDAGSSFEVTLAPFSLTHIRVPLKGKPLAGVSNEPTEDPAATAPELKVLLPDSIYVGDSVTGFVQACRAGTDQPFPAPLPAAVLEADREVKFDRQAARLAEAIGSFRVVASEPGPLTITARSGSLSVQKLINVKPSIARPMVLWDFKEAPVDDAKTFRSEFKLVADASLRANKDVARVDLPEAGVIPSEKTRQRALLVVSNWPPEKELDRSNIRGVVFDVMTRGFACEDPNAKIQVVMQSPANYWMVLGSVPLKDLQAWGTHQIEFSDPKLIAAVESAYNVWFVLSTNKPARGSICFDRIGLMVR